MLAPCSPVPTPQCREPSSNRACRKRLVRTLMSTLCQRGDTVLISHWPLSAGVSPSRSCFKFQPQWPYFWLLKHATNFLQSQGTCTFCPLHLKSPPCLCISPSSHACTELLLICQVSEGVTLLQGSPPWSLPAPGSTRSAYYLLSWLPILLLQNIHQSMKLYACVML